MESNELWYVGYGSNLSEQRFLSYIKGGQPEFGGKIQSGCQKKESPRENRAITIPHSLFFGLPEGNRETENWGTGGVAFIDPETTNDASRWTHARAWRITSSQFEDVWVQEGKSWYGRKVTLDTLDDDPEKLPVVTITTDLRIAVLPPSESYVRTIAAGLMECRGFSLDDCVRYLTQFEGIKGAIEEDRLRSIISAVF